MSVVFKYTLELRGKQTLLLPSTRHFLSLQNQDGNPTMWVAVNPESPLTKVDITMYGTGQPGPQWLGWHLGTVDINGFVWHYFCDKKL